MNKKQAELRIKELREKTEYYAKAYYEQQIKKGGKAA